MKITKTYLTFCSMAACLLATLPLASCSDPAIEKSELGQFAIEPVDNSAGPGSIAPSLTATSKGVVLSWLEPVLQLGEPIENEPKRKSPQTWQVKASMYSQDSFGRSTSIVEGTNFFANWADFPSIAEHPSGALLTHHLAKLGLGTFAYGAYLSSNFGNRPDWSSLGLLHDDNSPTEHGFVSYTRDGDQLRAFWLDGREMAVEGPMTLRTTLITSQRTVLAATAGIEMASTSVDAPGSSVVLDDRVCECCSTDAATTSSGPLVVYRNRSEDEIRDIYVVRSDNGKWSDPVLVHKDGWKIEGCPVNGPAVVARGDLVAVAWFTAANDKPRVQLALSRDGGKHFEKPIIIQDGGSQGRVDLAIGSDPGSGDVDLWLAHLSMPAPTAPKAGEDQPSQGMAVLLDHFRISEQRTLQGKRRVVAESSSARAAGFPRIAVLGANLFISWVAPGEPSEVRTARIVSR